MSWRTHRLVVMLRSFGRALGHGDDALETGEVLDVAGLVQVTGFGAHAALRLPAGQGRPTA